MFEVNVEITEAKFSSFEDDLPSKVFWISTVRKKFFMFLDIGL